MVFGQGPLVLRGTFVASGSNDVSIPSTFCVYRRIKRPSSASVASIWWKGDGFAFRVKLDNSRTMSWKELVAESFLYTDASKRCLPEDFNLCWLRKVVKRPVEERKSGTGKRLERFNTHIRGTTYYPRKLRCQLQQLPQSYASSAVPSQAFPVSRPGTYDERRQRSHSGRVSRDIPSLILQVQ